MNQPIRRVFDSYALCLLLAVAFPPWQGTPLLAAVGASGPVYAWIWSPPRDPGWIFLPDFPRLFLEIISLTLILVVAKLFLRNSSSSYSQ
ncbi:hypothetical protein JCM30471_28460 [Desulfuromonas carbonis]